MSNMSYCRFHNTEIDLQDCLYDLEERGGLTGTDEYKERLSSQEFRAAKRIIGMCVEIAERFGEDYENVALPEDEGED